MRNWYKKSKLLGNIIPKKETIEEILFNIQPIYVDSSFIQTLSYNKDFKILTIRMKNGKEYVYENVSPKRFKELMSADSKGKYFNEYIKPNYNVIIK